MTALRDARFTKALETAPDADARPAPAVAQAIKVAARKALPAPPSAPQAWWQRLWRSTGSPRAPWSAAFASLLLAVLVTVMWVHEPVPDARPTAPSAPALPAKPQAPEAPATAPTPDPAPGVAPAPLRKAEPAPAPYAMSDAAPSTDAQDKQARADNPAPSARAKALATPAPMPQAAATASNRLVAPQPAGNTNAAARDVTGWTRVDIAMTGQSGSANPPDAQALINRVQALLRQSTPELGAALPLPDTEPLLRLSIHSPGAPLASLSLWANLLRWQREGLPEVRRPVQDDEVQALLLLARQALAQNTAPPN